MENEMVERVATALIAETARQIRAGEEPALGNNPRLLAKAAIEAMRQPTAAILDAGPMEPYMDADVWAKMIDAALGRVPA
jgi:hypothetical protein